MKLLAMVDAFLATEFEGGRHEARVIKASGSRLAVTDPALFDVICAEENRQNLNIELIASENFHQWCGYGSSGQFANQQIC